MDPLIKQSHHALYPFGHLNQDLSDDLFNEIIKHLGGKIDISNLVRLNHFLENRIIMIVNKNEDNQLKQFAKVLIMAIPRLGKNFNKTSDETKFEKNLIEIEKTHTHNKERFGVTLLLASKEEFEHLRKQASSETTYNETFHFAEVFQILKSFQHSEKAKDFKNFMGFFKEYANTPIKELVQKAKNYNSSVGVLNGAALSLQLLKRHQLMDAVSLIKEIKKKQGIFFNHYEDLFSEIIQKANSDLIKNNDFAKVVELTELLRWNFPQLGAAALQLFELGFKEDAYKMIEHIPDTHLYDTSPKFSFYKQAVEELFKGNKQEAFQLAMRVGDEKERSNILKQMSERLIASGSDLRLAKEMIDAISDSYIKLDALKTLFSYLISIKEHQEALSIANDLRDNLKFQALKIIAKELMKKGVTVVAEEAVSAISDPAIKKSALSDLIHILIQKGEVAKVIERIKTFPDDEGKQGFFFALFDVAQTGDQQKEVIQHALNTLAPINATKFLEMTALKFLQRGDPLLAGWTACLVADEKIRNRLLGTIIETLLEEHNYPVAMFTVSFLSKDELKIEFLEEIARKLFKHREYVLAKEAITKMPDHPGKAALLQKYTKH